MSFHFPSHALSLFFYLHYSPPFPQSTSPLWVPLDSSPSLYHGRPFRLHVYSIPNSFSFPSHTDPLPYLLTNQALLNPKYVSVSPQLLRISRKKSLISTIYKYQVWGIFRSQSETWFCYLLPGKVWASDITSLNICFLICKMDCIHYNAFSLKENQPTYVASHNKVLRSVLL